ncbi:MAG: DNA-binding protein [Ruminococcus callidus]|nr:DNA-binding protein [Ruminococcus callidus]
MRELISRKDAARMLGISVKTLDKARIDGLIAYVQFTDNGCVFFTETALEEYVAKNTHRSKIVDGPKETFRKKRV